MFGKIKKGTTETNYIRIISGGGCYSYLGMIGGAQDLSLQAYGCTYIGTVAHEFIHALGIPHNFVFWPILF